MKRLVHICCAICWAKTLVGLRETFGPDTECAGLWYNPNIHPLLEYRRRLKALRVFMERDPSPVTILDEYGLSVFCEEIHGKHQPPGRCERCYRLRLGRTARFAAEEGFHEFTSTLCTSRHQDHELIRTIGEAAARKHGVRFLYLDLRQAEAPESATRGLYHQHYCGCVFSEEERYRDTTKHLYRGDAPPRTQ